MICIDYTTFRYTFATSATVANDGHRAWPVANLGLNSFAQPTGLPTVITTMDLPIILTANAGAADAVFLVDEYHWFLSQRTDVAAIQYLAITRSDTPPSSHSGSVRIGRTGGGGTVLGDYDAIRSIFRDVHLYVKRVSDGAIQHIDFMRDLYSST